MSVGELGCTYAALLLFDDGIPITAEKIAKVVKAANVSVESYWPNLILTVGTGGGPAVAVTAAPAAGGGAAAAAPATAEKKEEIQEDSDEDMALNLFD
ncbi:unnamed protein product [Withania somnifera]